MNGIEDGAEARSGVRLEGRWRFMRDINLKVSFSNLDFLTSLCTVLQFAITDALVQQSILY